MNKIYHLLVCLCFLFVSALQAQPVNNTIKDVSMPSPTAASLGKYGDIPVGYYTGIPNVNIPIHTVKDGPLSLPVSLSYHAGGMKVGEPVSWVGLGWSLQAGGMISRTIQGKADESCDGYFMSGKYMAVKDTFNMVQGVRKDFQCLMPTSQYTYATVQSGNTDAEPDIFSYSVGGYSGKFFIEADLTDDNVANGKVVLIPQQDVKISYEVTPNACSFIFRLSKFTITTPDGVRYQYGNIDNDANYKGIERQQLNESNFSTASGWSLRRITSADGQYNINLDYIQEKYRYQFKASGERSFNLFQGYPISVNGYPHHVMDVLGWRISTITSTGNLSKVTFNAASVNREDLSTTAWNVGSSPEPPKSLSSIKIESGTYCKQFDLQQSYYNDATADKSETSADKRLKLTGIQERTCSSPAIIIPAYSFQYHELTGAPTFLPNRLSPAVDHWGFYNGATSNPKSGLNIPVTKLPTYVVGGYNVNPIKGGSNRETNFDNMKLGTLNKITYPTGGSTGFEYEANTVYQTKDSSSFEIEGSLTRTQGFNGCSEDQTAAASFNLTGQSSSALSNLYYVWAKNPPAPFPSTCSEGPYLQIYLKNATTNAIIGSVSTSLSPTQSPSTADGKLMDLFSAVTIPAGVPLRFEIRGKAMWGTFTVRKLTASTTSKNYLVGGLRVKKITTKDGTTASQDVIKSYTYENATISSQSSGILYSQPVYGHVVQKCVGGCNFITDQTATVCPLGTYLQTHFFFETAVVPLTSFEGYHIGYSSVKEYHNVSNTGYYNFYQHYNDAAVLFDGLPVTPLQPRIGSGELESKAYRTASSGDVAYDYYEKNAELSTLGQGTYVKINTYYTNGDPGGSPVVYWKEYPIATSPFRYNNILSFRDGQLTTTTKQYNSTSHLQATKETITNSDGKLTATDYKYSFDMPGLPANQINQFKDLNLLVPLQTTVTVGATQVSGTQTDYDFYSITTGARTSTLAGSFIRPYQFKNYEGSSWVLKGQLDSYHGTGTTTGRAGLPKQFTKAGWSAESYEWNTAGLIKKRQFNNFNWQYDYFNGTGMVTKVTNPDGQFTEYFYDPLMRLQETKTRANNAKITYDYTYPTVNSSGIITSFGRIKSTMTFAAIPNVAPAATRESFQYFDGLGRTIQTVNKGKTASGKDQVVATAYDNQGRVNKTFEPFGSSVSDGSYQSPASNPFTLSEYEDNSLNRIWKITPPSWAATINTYGSNSAADAVKNYNFTNGSSSIFAAELLTKAIITDGNGNKTITFTDKKGRTLLNRRANANESSTSDTYYVYDDKDRLVRVIPPGASWGDAELVFTYQYTNNDLISQKKVPGKAYEAFEYNSRDLPVKYQDPFLRATAGGRWMGSKYDVYGRLTEKGVWASGNGDAISLSNKIIENIYGTSGIEIDKLKTSKVQVFDVNDPVVNLNANNSLVQSTVVYDSYGRMLSTTGNNHTNVANTSAETVTYGYDHADNIVSESRISIHSAGTTTVANARLFDNWGRITQSSQGINGATATIISRLSYNDKDQLSQKKLGPGPNGLQQVDYGYLPNGMLQHINGLNPLSNSSIPISNMLENFNTPTFTATNDDLFRQVLEYNSLTGELGGSQQNSGNIGQMIWQSKGRTSQAYGFTYDYLDRLTNSKYSSYSSPTAINTANYYGESQSFDERGNIMSINRNGMIKGTTKYSNSLIDAQTMTINAGSNQSQKSDGTNSDVKTASDNFDAPHNHLNLPIKFQFGSNNSIEFLYDGLGNKLKKTVKTNSVETLIQDYLAGIELKNNKVDAVYNEEGRAYNTATNGQTYRYEYVLRDHLGNTRLVFSDKNGSGSIDNSEILSETNYYPFGKAFEGAWYTDATASKYKYLYNGKELNEEFKLNSYDYGARWLDPGLGSWLQVDPMAEASENMSPYNYGSNNPVSNVDFLGLTDINADGIDDGTSLPEATVTGKREGSYESMLNTIQMGLDGFGMIPLLGSAASGVNAGIDIYRGNYASAGLNAVSTIPGVGTLIKGYKIAAVSTKVVSSIAKMKAVKAAIPLAVRMMRPANTHLHHIIPISTYRKNRHLLDDAFKIDNIDNLMPLSTTVHGNHPAYSEYVAKKIATLAERTNGKLNMSQINEVIQSMEGLIQKANNSGMSINNYFKQF